MNIVEIEHLFQFPNTLVFWRVGVLVSKTIEAWVERMEGGGVEGSIYSFRRWELSGHAGLFQTWNEHYFSSVNQQSHTKLTYMWSPFQSRSSTWQDSYKPTLEQACFWMKSRTSLLHISFIRQVWDGKCWRTWQSQLNKLHLLEEELTLISFVSNLHKVWALVSFTLTLNFVF